jgi:hypothetical protein
VGCCWGPVLCVGRPALAGGGAGQGVLGVCGAGVEVFGWGGIHVGWGWGWVDLMMQRVPCRFEGMER